MTRFMRGLTLVFATFFGVYKVCTWFITGALGQWPMTTADALGLFVLLFTGSLTFCIAIEDFQ